MTNMKKPANLTELIDLVHEAVYEVDELRACLEHDDEEAATTPRISIRSTPCCANCTNR